MVVTSQEESLQWSRLLRAEGEERLHRTWEPGSFICLRGLWDAASGQGSASPLLAVSTSLEMVEVPRLDQQANPVPLSR